MEQLRGSFQLDERHMTISDRFDFHIISYIGYQGGGFTKFSAISDGLSSSQLNLNVTAECFAVSI